MNITYNDVLVPRLNLINHCCDFQYFQQIEIVIFNASLTNKKDKGDAQKYILVRWTKCSYIGIIITFIGSFAWVGALCW